ncbi:MAG: DUF131 domain-containing protein [Candidatus Bathyarchaeia archaeon]
MMLALNAGTLYDLGIIIIFIGVMLILFAFALLFLSHAKNGKLRGGGAVIIGPFPIVFGTDRECVKAVLWLSIALTILLFVVFITFYLLGR